MSIKGYRPTGWQSNELSVYYEHAFRHQLATYENKRGPFLRISRIDRLFSDLLEGWRDPPKFLEAIISYRVHSAFRVAGMVTMSGALSESFCLQRLCLELAGYIVRIYQEPQLAETWLNRDVDQTSLKAVRKEFEIKKIKNAIAAYHPETATIFAELYERCISWGAHPNEKAVTIAGVVAKLENSKQYEQIYLHADGDNFDMALRTLMQVGVCSLDMIGLVFAGRFKDKNIGSQLGALKKGL